MAEEEPRTQDRRLRSELWSASSANRPAAVPSSSAEKKASDECVESVETARRTEEPLPRRLSIRSSAGGVSRIRPSALQGVSLPYTTNSQQAHILTLGLA